jgi:TetR/AcrR family tetracycline transcriptional repressor
VNILIGAVLQAGFEGRRAAHAYRAIGDFALAWAGAEASFLALDPALQRDDRAAWNKEYLAVSRYEYPHTWLIREELPRVDDDEIFETALGFFMAGLIASAPRPCACGSHLPADV